MSRSEAKNVPALFHNTNNSNSLPKVIYCNTIPFNKCTGHGTVKQ